MAASLLIAPGCTDPANPANPAVETPPSDTANPANPAVETPPDGTSLSPRVGTDAPPPGVGSAEALASLDFTVDWTAGGTDPAGRPLGGTETMWLAGHQGSLFAGNGYWQTPPGSVPFEGAYVMRQDSVGGPWQVEHSVADSGRINLLKQVTFDTDGTGRKLDKPVLMLIASPDDITAPFEMRVMARDDESGTWDTSIITDDAIGTRESSRERAYLRSATTHTDAVTGVDAIFGGAGNGLIYRGVYDPSAPGRLRWDPQPELDPDGGRIHSMAVANGTLYAAAGVEEDGENATGGLYRRIDGPEPRWELVYRWTLPFRNANAGMRGLTAIRMPDGRDDLLAAREEPGVIERIDLDNDYAATTEFDIRAEYTAAWGSLGAATLAAYNDMLPVVDSSTGGTSYLIGLFVNHPQRDQPPTNGSNYLVRSPDGTYERAVVFDETQPVPAGKELRATRHIVPSPYPGDNAFYFAGFDAGGRGSKTSTAWIYRAEMPNP
jgi:hypothetical protein